MGEPIRSRLLDYIEAAPSRASATEAAKEPQPIRSRLLDYADALPPARPDTDRPPGPKPGVPAYHTPVFVPAHPRYLETTAQGRPARVSFIAYELFEHPSDGVVAFAFTRLERLVAALGEAQPWIAASIGPLAEGMLEHGAGVRVDPWVAPGHHNWQPADLASYAHEVH